MPSFDRDSPTQRMSRGLHTSVVDNSSAFGFSIMITATFGVLSTLLGSPGIAEIFGFALAAAASLTAFLVATSRGFKRSPDTESRQVILLGVAMNFVSVGAAVGAAALVGEVVHSWPGWPVGALTASSVYIVAEATELALAEFVQRGRSDPEAR